MSGHYDSLVRIHQSETLATRSWDALRTSRARIEQSQVLLAGARPGGPDVRAIERLALQDVVKRAGALCVPRVAYTRSRTEAILADAYEIDIACVRRDVNALAHWDLPFDELLVDLCRLRRWEIGTATIYLGALRSLLVAGGISCPWLEDDDA